MEEEAKKRGGARPNSGRKKSVDPAKPFTVYVPLSKVDVEGGDDKVRELLNEWAKAGKSLNPILQRAEPALPSEKYEAESAMSDIFGDKFPSEERQKMLNCISEGLDVVAKITPEGIIIVEPLTEQWFNARLIQSMEKEMSKLGAGSVANQRKAFLQKQIDKLKYS